MKASNFLNTVVWLQGDRKWRGQIADIRVRDHTVDCFVLSEGGLFSRAQIFLPGSVTEAAYDHIAVASDAAICRLSKRAFRERLAGTHSVFGVRVRDVDGDYFARTADAVIGNDYHVKEYELSRSFFDDLDRGYGIVPAAELTLAVDGALVYAKDMLAIQETGREGGVIKKLLGEENGR